MEWSRLVSVSAGKRAEDEAAKGTGKDLGRKPKERKRPEKKRDRLYSKGKMLEISS